MNVNIGKDESTPPDSARDFGSEPESAPSPAASGFSDQHDGRSSADTTPPPQTETYHGGFAFRNAKRSSNDSTYARSFQSTASNGFLAGSAPHNSGFASHKRQGSHDRRPPSSGVSGSGQEDRDLAAAVELLSCSFNSNGGSRDTRLPKDAPPVPPLPARYLEQAAFSSTSFLNSYSARQMPESFTRGSYRQASEDVKMEDSEVDDDDDEDRRSRVRSEDDDDGVFGRMEE